MKFKKITALLLATVMVSALAACGSGSGTATEVPAAEGEEVSAEPKTSAAAGADYTGITDVKIALIGETSGGNFWGNIEQGFGEAAEARGWESVYWAPADAETGDAGVLDLAETALIQGYNEIGRAHV